MPDSGHHQLARWVTARVDAVVALLDVNALVALAWDSHVHLLVLARRNDMRLVTFEAGIANGAEKDSVELLTS